MTKKKIADQIVIVIEKDARVQAVLVVHLEVVHLHQVVRQEVQAPAPVLHVPALVTRRNQTEKDEDQTVEVVVEAVLDDLEMTEIHEEIETGTEAVITGIRTGITGIKKEITGIKIVTRRNHLRIKKMTKLLRRKRIQMLLNLLHQNLLLLLKRQKASLSLTSMNLHLLVKNLLLTSRLPFLKMKRRMTKKTLKRKKLSDPDPDQIPEDGGASQVIAGADPGAPAEVHPEAPAGVPHVVLLPDEIQGDPHQYRKKSVCQN